VSTVLCDSIYLSLPITTDLTSRVSEDTEFGFRASALWCVDISYRGVVRVSTVQSSPQSK